MIFLLAYEVMIGMKLEQTLPLLVGHEIVALMIVKEYKVCGLV